MIDIHTHLGKIFYGRNPLTPGKLVKTMDRYGIEKAVVLPVENPEETHWYHTTEQVLRECKRYPERLIPFCNVDPRRDTNSEEANLFPLVEEYVKRGCKGFGEILANLPANDPRMKNVYRICGKLQIPVLMHLGEGSMGITDEIGFPRLEECLKEFTDTVFIAHGPAFWAEMSADVTVEDKKGYPKGKIEKPGKVDYLLESYPNLYGDLSAESGYNALARDPEYAKKFLNKHHRKLLFGTDYLYPSQELPIIDFLKKIDVEASLLDFIYEKNAKEILKL